MADEVTHEQIEREINYRFPRDHHTREYEQKQALEECAGEILALFAPLREELAALRGQVVRLVQAVDERAAFMEREGYRACDNPACNCGSWHDTERSRRIESTP